MPDQQANPPKPKKGFTPKMLVYFERLIDYLKGQRIVESGSLKWGDADGGGKKGETKGDSFKFIVCVDNGDTTFTQKTVTVVDSLIVFSE